APEATNSVLEQFGIERMLEALNRDPDASPEEQLATLKQAVDEFVGDAAQFDDLTMMAIKMN
ncbi:MAG: SpoIIE family protein phosphatase, partial [Lachnospiraceae bacterium]|nr:SpoIIE family protein phosphatase [Lachnospiraceae bacterium]